VQDARQQHFVCLVLACVPWRLCSYRHEDVLGDAPRGIIEVDVVAVRTSDGFFSFPVIFFLYVHFVVVVVVVVAEVPALGMGSRRVEA